MVFSFFLVSLLCLFFRLGFLQIFRSSEYLSIAQNQHRVMIEMQPTRGRIVDRRGRELALDIRLDSVYAVAREVKDKEKLAADLARILGQDPALLLRKLQRDKMFVWIGRKISATQAEQIRRLKAAGLGFVKESLRAYPKGETACHLVGFTDIDNNGLEGIELNYNSFLKGVPGWRLGQRDAKQRELVSKEVEVVPPVDGFNIHLTIDEVIQSLSDQVLAETCKKFNALGGSIIVLDPKTGDVLAMSTYPVYDPNSARSSKPEQRRNRAITDLYEPGSVFKTFTLSAILENKAVRLDEKFDCENGSWAVAGKVLHDHRGSGVLTLREIIEKSSNIGTVKAALRLGGPKLYDTIKNFGFGERTGIALAGEVSGIVPNPKNWSRS
ncbi:MAG TPA: penicillin-binding protein 2, partial [Candidatus Eisenbacteria bacterium]|nr:penicillin-binding protein 2 [Candidatus Eisenbacteria bacterium]